MVGSMPPTEQARERRQHARVPVRGDVQFHIGDHEFRGRLVTISDAALEIRCQLGFAILGMAGQPVELVLDLDGTARWVLTGHVQFVRASTHTLVISYDRPTPDLAREIETLIAGTREHAASLQLMLRARARDDRERAAADDVAYEQRDRKPEPS
jgi:hypothetical protein